MNSEMNLFNPVDLDLSRSTFEYHPTRSGTGNVGRLLPVFCTEILPGDSVKMDVRSLVKFSTPVYPTMDQLYLDLFFFFVPNRLVLGNRYGSPSATDSNRTWAAIVGAQDNLVGAPLPASGLTVPSIKVYRKPSPGVLNDYFVGNSTSFDISYGSDLNCLPYLSYFAIYNENFRDESTTTPITWGFTAQQEVILYGVVPLWCTSAEFTASSRTGSLGGNYGLVNALAKTATPTDLAEFASDHWLPLPVSRFHGYFGSALPWPQRNIDGVELPLGDSAPIVTGVDLGSDFATGADGLLWRATSNGAAITGRTAINIATDGTTGAGSTGSVAANPIVPANLYADLSHATAANVNALRAAIQKQRWYEKLARSGNRFDELEYGLFGVRPHDSGLDRPLYLGGKRIALNVEMVASTNGATAGDLGKLGAFSHTNDNDHYFYHSFDEWGILMCVACVRHHDTFSSGIDKMWTRLTRDQYYFPTFAHLGEQIVDETELGNDYLRKGNVFGFQQAWEEYRQAPDRVTGLLAPGRSLGYMTYATDYTAPTLATFLNASYQVQSVDQTLVTASYSAGFQFVYQFTFDYTMRRCLPTYSIPGLMDHF